MEQHGRDAQEKDHGKVSTVREDNINSTVATLTRIIRDMKALGEDAINLGNTMGAGEKVSPATLNQLGLNMKRVANVLDIEAVEILCHM